MPRIREIICNSDIKSKLVRLIPKEDKELRDEIKLLKCSYPSPLIKLLPNTYSDFGIITEIMLQSQSPCTAEILKNTILETLDLQIEEKILNLASVKQYIERVEVTRQMILEMLDPDEQLLYDCVLTNGDIEGHPDIMTSKKIFEVKTSCKAATDWYEYLTQVFSYAALSKDLNIQTIHIVLPLHETIWSFDLTQWSKCEDYIKVLQSYEPYDLDDVNFGRMICCTNNVGAAIPKERGSIVNTLKSIVQYSQPFQFFLNGNLATNVTMSDMEMDEAYAFLLAHPKLKVYVHLPYTITLSNDINEKDGFTLRSLAQYMTCITRMGIRGGVVHVGKSNQYDVHVAIENMRLHLIAALEYATPESPILLESPSGQGNELLTTFESFMEFMDSIPDERLGICIDTCHVFASGENLTDYFAKLISNERWISRVKLIHFNDSKKPQGSCVDRHAPIGCGCIPKDDFINVACIASIHGIPMLVE